MRYVVLAVLSLALLSLPAFAQSDASVEPASAAKPAPAPKLEPALVGIKCLESRVGGSVCVVCAREGSAPGVSCYRDVPAPAKKAAKKAAKK